MDRGIAFGRRRRGGARDIRVSAKGEAEKQRTAAERNEQQAIANQQRAEENEKRASENDFRALAQQRLAEEQRTAAQSNLAGQSALLAQLSEEQARAGNSERSINLALSALPRNLADPDRPVVERALSALHFAVDQDRKYMTLAGHGNSVMFATYSHDGKRIVTTSSDKTARLWNAGTGELVRELAGHDDVVMHAAFSGDNEKLVTTSGPLARVWNARTGEALFTLNGHRKNIQQIVFTPDNRRIVTGAWDNTARIWDANSGEPLFVLDGPAWNEVAVSAGFGVADPIMRSVMKATHQIFGSMQLVDVSPDGKYVATAGRVDQQAAVRLWEVETGKLRRSLTGISVAIDYLFNDIRFSPDGTPLVAASGDNTGRVWNTITGEQMLVLRDHDKQVNSARFSFDGKRIVTASIDGSARIWDAATGRVIGALHGHRDQIYQAQFSPDGSLVLTVSTDKMARLWNGTNGAPVANLIGHQDRVLSGGFSPDGRHIITTSRDGSAIVWLARVGEPISAFGAPADVEKERYELYHHERPVQVSDGNTRVFVGTTHIGRMGHLINGATGAVIASIEGQSGVFVDQGRALLTATRGGASLRLWNAETGGLIQPLPGVALDLHLGSAVLVSGLGTTVHVYDLKAATIGDARIRS